MLVGLVQIALRQNNVGSFQRQKRSSLCWKQVLLECARRIAGGIVFPCPNDRGEASKDSKHEALCRTGRKRRLEESSMLKLFILVRPVMRKFGAEERRAKKCSSSALRLKPEVKQVPANI